MICITISTLVSSVDLHQIVKVKRTFKLQVVHAMHRLTHKWRQHRTEALVTTPDTKIKTFYFYPIICVSACQSTTLLYIYLKEMCSETILTSQLRSIELSLSIYLPATLTTYLPICRSICLYLSLPLSIYILIPIDLFIHLSTCLSIYLSIYLTVCLSVSLSVCLSIYLTVYTLISPSI